MVVPMAYDEETYVKYFNKLKVKIFKIKLSEKTSVNSLISTKIGNDIQDHESKPVKSLFSAFCDALIPNYEYNNLNNCIKSINLTLEQLVSSYALLKLQDDYIKSNVEDNSNYYWLIYYYEVTINNISTLDELTYILVNYSMDLNYQEDRKLKKNIDKYLKNHYVYIQESLRRKAYSTKLIRNDFNHNTKPFFYKDRVTIKDGLTTFGKGTRKLDILEDLYHIDNDIDYLIQKYRDLISELELSFLSK